MEENKVIDAENVEVEVGQVQIADDVIAVIAEIAATEVEGIVQIGPSKNDLVQTFMSKNMSKKMMKGIKVEVGEGEVFVDVMCIVRYGIKIQDVCLKVQEKVKNSIETMTGLDVSAVNVYVVGVTFAKESSKDEH